MITINLNAESKAQKRLKEFLEQNASETLADKINNGVYIEKDGKRLLNKKDFDGFIKYATEEARKQAAKGDTGACLDDSEVFGWVIHYFEEDDIIGTLFNEDGSEYKAPTPVKTTTPSVTYTPPKPAPKPQMSIFDMLTEDNAENSVNSSILPPQSQNPAKPPENTEKTITPDICADKRKKQPSLLYQTYLKLIEKHKGFLILYRLGDFYEAFGEHATTLSNELDLTLTGRDVGLDERVPMTGIPYHAVDNYVNKLIDHGYKVILAEDLDNILEFKPLDEYEEPEELSEEEMRKFDNYVDDEDEELTTVSQIIGQIDDDEDEDNTCPDILYAENAKAFDKEAMSIIFELLDNEITLA